MIDPTYDQLWSPTDERNAIFLRMGSSWKYVTEWGDGADLFPDQVLNMDTSRRKPHDLYDEGYYHKGGIEFLNKAFANPVELSF